MWLHICCGDIYLKDYINIDAKGTLISNVKENPNETTIDNYYKKEFKDALGHPSPFIVDKIMNITKKWICADNSVDRILMISAIEHFTKKEAEFIISEIKRVLKSGGEFIFDFPNILEDIKRYYGKNPDFLMELIYCNHKNKYSIHKWGYTPKSIRELLGKEWSRIDFKIIVKHNYPMISIYCVKQ